MAGWLTGTLPNYYSVSGLEEIAADTNLSGGAAPQSVQLNINQIDPLTLTRNLFDGGNFTANPWQRGTAFTGITNSATYTADRWFAIGGASSSISVSKAAITAGSLAGFGSALQFGRAAANADTAAIKFGQVIETNKTIRLQGQPLVLSFWALPGANVSAAGSNVTVTVYSGTGTNDTVANMLSGSWAGQKTLYTGNLSIVNTAWGQRYVIGGTPGTPYSNITGGLTGAPSSSSAVTPSILVPTNASQLGVVFSYVPVGTAGANDWVQFTGIQLEAGNYPGLFEHADAGFVLSQAQRYFYQISEPAVGVIVALGGATVAANAQKYLVPLPVQMLKAPAVSVSAGTFKAAVGAAVATATGLAAASTHTPNAISLVTTLTQTAGGVAHLEGAGGTGYIAVSADF